MADNTILNVGTGGDVIATDDIAGVKHQLVKLEYGAADSATQVSPANPLPVVQTGELPAGTQNIGDVDVASIAAGDNNIGNVDIVTMPAVVLAAGTANVGDVDVLTVPAPLSTSGGGTEAAALRVTLANDSTGVVSVDDNGGSLTVDGTVAVSSLPALVAGSANIGDVDVLTLPNVTLAAGTNTNEVVGDVAHDSAVGGNPLLLAGRAETAEDNDTNTNANRTDTDGDVTRLAVDRYGALFVRHGTPFQFSFTNKSASQQTNAAIHAAPAAGLSIYITDIYFAANGAVNVTIETATPTTLWAYYAAAGGDGATFQPKVPIKLPAATALQYDTSAAVEHTLVVCGYIAP